MKTTSLHIAFAALLSLLLLASCSRNDEVAVAEGEEGKVQVTFTLKLDNESSASRAMSRAEDNTWGDEYNYDLGNDYDNRINDLQVVIYEGNTFKCKVTNLSFYKNEEKNEYTYLGSISETLTANTKYKIMVFANCADITSETDLSDLSYTYNENMGIPMWGVITQTLSLVPGSREELGVISLLRAFAKVEVSMNVEGYTLQSVSIDNSNKQGYCLPKDYTLVGNTTDLDREEDTNITTFNPYKDSEKIEDRTFTNENGTYYIYLPEYDNGTEAAKITVTVNGEIYELEFKDYENGAPKEGTQYNIVRNHIYRYTITGVNDGKLVIKYKAMLWELVTSEIGYTASIFCDLRAENSDEEAQYGILHKPTYTSKKYNNGGDYSILKPGTAGAIYRFDLQAPAGTVWTAHLSNNEDFYFSDSNYKDDKKLVSTGIARGSSDKYLPYYIQINARNPWQAIEDENGEDLEEGEIGFNTLSDWGRKVESEHRVVDTYFYITVSVDGIHETELEINPIESENTDFKGNRRFPGTATRIWIRQVPAQKGRGQENQEGKETWQAQELAKNINPTDAEFQWWRVNPYWK